MGDRIQAASEKKNTVMALAGDSLCTVEREPPWPNPKCSASKKGAGRRNAMQTQMSGRLRSVRPEAGGCPTGVVFGRFALSMGVIWPGSSLVRLGSDSSGKDAPPVARDQIVAVPACSAPAGFPASAHELSRAACVFPEAVQKRASLPRSD